MFRKHLEEVTIPEIEQQVAAGIWENNEIELKGKLPTRDGGQHPWESGNDKIPDYTRNKLLAEIIALANSFGGHLLIGIDETNEKPARAARITPLPRCADFAERLREQCRMCIDPPVHLLEIVPVTNESNGSGVIIVRVPRSRSAPHRGADLQSYYRRGTSTVVLSMREIQELTLRIDRGLAAVESKFSALRKAFIEWLENFGTTTTHFGLHLVALPLSPLTFDRVYDRDNLKPRFTELSATLGRKQALQLMFPFPATEWRPIVRGTQGVGFDRSHHVRQKLGCDGSLEFSFALRDGPDHPNVPLFPSWVLGYFASALICIEIIRAAAGMPSVEYGMEFRLVVHPPSMVLRPYVGNGEHLGSFETSVTEFPRYSVGPRQEFIELMAMVDRDMLDAVGYKYREHGDATTGLTVDFSPAFRKLGLESEVQTPEPAQGA